jgi:hypothetical protein
VRTVGYSIASALSATVLAVHVPAGGRVPADAGYSAAAAIATGVLVATLMVSGAFAVRRGRAEPGPDPAETGAAAAR